MKRCVQLTVTLVLFLCLLIVIPMGAHTESPEGKILYLPSNARATSANPYIGSMDADVEIISLITARPYGNIPREDKAGSMLVPMLAAGEPVDSAGDGTVWRFSIREDAMWENGEPINADTFMYSYKMLLDPALLMNHAGAFSNTYIEIENATAYFSQGATGVSVPWDDVGIKKIDDYTLEIKLTSSYSKEEFMRHFSVASASPVYEPLFEDGMNEGRTETTYGSEKDQIISSGPFVLAEWIKGSERRFVKNSNFARADLVKLDGITYRVVEDRGTQQQMFEKGELDSVLLDADGVQKYSEDPRFTPAASAYIRMIDLCDTNESQPILANLNFKKALFYGIDRQTIAKLSKKTPATYVIPHTSIAYADGTAFRDLEVAKDYLPENNGFDPDLALEYFNTALKETGIDKVELNIILSSTSVDHKIIAEFLQEAWPQLFGSDRFKLNLNAMPGPQSLEVRKSSPQVSDAYELGLADWALAAGTYNPSKHIETFTSMYARRNAPYHSDRLDDLFRQSILPENRMDEVLNAKLAAEMEKVIIDEVVTIPVLENQTFYMFSDRLEFPMDRKDSSLSWGYEYADII